MRQLTTLPAIFILFSPTPSSTGRPAPYTFQMLSERIDTAERVSVKFVPVSTSPSDFQWTCEHKRYQFSTIWVFRIFSTSIHPSPIAHCSQYTRHFQNNDSIQRLFRFTWLSSVLRLAALLAAAAGAVTTTRGINVSEPVNAENSRL